MGVKFRMVSVASALLVVSACSGSDSGDAASVPTASSIANATDTAAEGDVFEPTATTATEPDGADAEGDTRPVPTVAPSTIAGQTGTTTPGVVNASPTIAPPPPPPVDPDEPATTPPPPTTELLTDPQPNPDTTRPPVPDTVEAPPSACDRLLDFGVASIVAEAGGSEAVADVTTNDICTYTAGSVVAEVHFIDEAIVLSDWYTREGIEPVSAVGGDAVGFDSFLPPDATPTEGYTIALVGGRRGLIVGVRGTADARFVAGQVAVFANQAA